MSDRYAKFEHLLFDRPAEHVLRITINAPERMNALNLARHLEIERVFAVVDGDPETRVSIITGAGKAFCAGMDFSSKEQAPVEPADVTDKFVDGFAHASGLVDALIEARKPIISAINGPAVGAGLAIALLADISIAATTAKIFDGHLRIGVVPGDHGALIWPLLCGLAKAKYFLMSNEPMTGADAERHNLVSLAVSPELLQDKAIAVATGLAQTSPSAMAMTKYVMNHWLRQMRPIFDLSLALELVGIQGRDANEAVSAYMQKRPPVFNPPKSEF